jgi:hypothetical protein
MFSEFKRLVTEGEAFNILAQGGDVLCESADSNAGKAVCLVLSGPRDLPNLGQFVAYNADEPVAPVTFWAKGAINPENEFPGDREYPTMTGHY